MELQRSATDAVGEVPFVVLINKADLVAEWDVDREAVEAVAARGWPVLRTSAKTGLGVESAFLQLAPLMMEP